MANETQRFIASGKDGIDALKQDEGGVINCLVKVISKPAHWPWGESTETDEIG